MIKGYIPNCVFEANNPAPIPLQRLICVLFPLPVLIDGVNLRLGSPVQFVYSIQTLGGLTTDQKDQKLDRRGDRKTKRISPGSDCEALKLSWDWRKPRYFRGYPMVNLSPLGLLHI